MKLGLQNYVFIMSIENSYMQFNNNEINSLQRYDAQNYRILHKVVQRFSEPNFKISNHHHIQKLHKRK
jgi:hypothetical protein